LSHRHPYAIRIRILTLDAAAEHRDFAFFQIINLFTVNYVSVFARVVKYP